MEPGRLIKEIVFRDIPRVLLDAQRVQHGYLWLAIMKVNTRHL